MGFDNECILNIQSLRGEYFCPVCRLLVYPNEALQSQCTHLYCKPCLSYVVSTTRACPYDGYLVTEADSKPLLGSNKTLAETIGKITVHCLYHRSGCTWKGPLSECTAHCSGCLFGNSPVVCNRCGIQIVHRQVQEHAQNCPSVQPQSQQADGGQETAATGPTATADQTQLASQAGKATSEPQASQTTTSSTPGQDPSQQANPHSQSQAVSQAAVGTSDQWYQQQYQQYYQQYSGYELYYQQYYPYQQQAFPQYQQQPLQVTAPQMAGPSPMLQAQPQPQTQVQPQTQAQPQSHPSVQGHVAAQPQNKAQVSQQQQANLTVPEQSQNLSQTAAQGHPQPHPHVQTTQPQLQHGQIPQYQQHNSQMQQLQPQPQLVPPAQPPSHAQPGQPLNPSLLPQMQHPSAHAVTGHQTYSQPQPHQQMQLVTPQHPMQVHAHGGLQPQLQPPQSHAAISNQQQPGLLPSQGPMLQQGHPHSLQPGLPVQQRAVMQPAALPMSQQYVQQQPPSSQPVGLAQAQINQQGPFVQQQLPLQSQLRHPVPLHSFQQPPHAYAQPQQNVGGPHAVHPHPSHNLVGRPMTPNHGAPVKSVQLGVSQPSSYQNNAIRNNNQSGVVSQPISEVPGDHGTDTTVAEQEAESASHGYAKKEANEVDMASTLIPDIVETTTAKSKADLKSVDGKHTGDLGHSSGGVGISTKETPESRQTFGTDLEPQKDSMSKNMVKGEGSENQKTVHNGEHKVEENKIKDGLLLKSPPLEEAKLSEEQNGKMQKDKFLTQEQGTPNGPAVNGFRGIPESSQVQPGGFLQPSHSVPVFDQGRHQPLQMPYGSINNQQRPAASAMLQAPMAGLQSLAQTPGLPSNQFRPQGPGQAVLPPQTLPPGSSGKGPSNYGPQAPYNNGEPLVGPPFGTPPPAFDSHGAPSHAPEGHSLQQHSANMGNYHADNRRLDPRSSDLGSTSKFSLRAERLKPVQDERLNPFPLDHARGQFEEDLKQFPRPSHLDTEPVPKFGGYFSSSRSLDRGPHGFGMDMGLRAPEKDPRGLNFDPMIGPGPSRFLPPFHPDDERPVGHPEDTLGRPDFLGKVPSYGRHHMDGFVSRSPGREYPGISPHRFGRHPGEEINGRERRFNDRFPDLPGHLHRGVFEGSDQMEEHFRGRDMIGPDIRPPHFRRGEHFGHHSMPGHLRMGEPISYGDFPNRERMAEFGGPGNFRHSQLGEPGFRSSFSLQEFPNDGGVYTGDMDSFENLRKRKPVSMGWCRICKVDCETVEGLDLHSQTREHQKMAMDMVLTIKQNAKKQKLKFNDHSIRTDASKSKNAKSEGRVNKH
ncbi:TRAF-like protein [Corchorus capsularis]|uniref:TRAF-like protein n=1 Tax=Corchorus capsularis TaxID=210143 RepID=A0A1R3ITZ8_COCAP|nr:TRAF-like protein [Corchorus capsularis]